MIEEYLHRCKETLKHALGLGLGVETGWQGVPKEGPHVGRHPTPG